MRRLRRALRTLVAVLTRCAWGDKAKDGSNGEDAAVAWDALSFDKSMPLDYAAQFSVSYAGDEYKCITIGQDQEFLLVAEGAAVPGGVPEGGGRMASPPVCPRPKVCRLSNPRPPARHNRPGGPSAPNFNKSSLPSCTSPQNPLYYIGTRGSSC